MSEKINKLQIRAKVLDIIKSYTDDADFNTEMHVSNIKLLKSLNEKKFVIEILLKELVCEEGIQLEAVKYLLIDFAELNEIENSIWELLQDKNITDKKKEIYLQLLRALGGKIDVPLLMECMQDFNNVVDEQTKGLLELATVNPEAQIDFLDFLFSLKAPEQMQLIDSLKDDFKDDELANILSPCLRIDLAFDIKEEIINILSNSQSYLSVKPLKKYIQSNDNADLKKIALKGLNQLKNSGIDIDNKEIINLREIEICKASNFYKAYLSQVDGCGNQGLIFSRINDKNQIMMFSVVINVNDGIIDCFGLYNIAPSDFQKVITRFKADDIVVPISPQIAKYLIDRAEQLNNEKGTILPYEYICWSVYTCDIIPEAINYDSLLLQKMDNFNKDIYSEFYDTESFDSWFFEYDDNINVQKLIDKVFVNINEEKEKILNLVENGLETIYPSVFSEDKINEYSNMLKDAAYVFYCNQLFEKSNIAINLAIAIKNDENKFLKDIIRRSILQYLANIVADEDSNKEKNLFDKKNDLSANIPIDSAYNLLLYLEKEWS